MRCERVALTEFGRRRPPRDRILSLHSVTPAWGVNDVPPARFRRHLEVALGAGYEFVPASELASGVGDHGAARLSLTFDDGVRSVATDAAPILAENGIPWTLFVVTDWVEGHHRTGHELVLDWRELEALASREGVTIGSHSATHPDFGRLDFATAADELVRSREAIRRNLGLVVDDFAIPFGQSVNWTGAAAQAAREAGYLRVYAQSEDRRPPGTVPRTFFAGFDGDRMFRAALGGAFDGWEEWF
jgi:peptidoglycan/xylan/chitin deacetylase (PgdA/CDA1 family)